MENVFFSVFTIPFSPTLSMYIISNLKSNFLKHLEASSVYEFTNSRQLQGLHYFVQTLFHEFQVMRLCLCFLKLFILYNIVTSKVKVEPDVHNDPNFAVYLTHLY